MEKPSKPERITITLGAGQRREVEALAKHRRTSVATVIRWALDEFIKSQAIDEHATRNRLHNP